MVRCRKTFYGRDNALAFAVPTRGPEHLTIMSDRPLGTDPVYRQLPQHLARDLARQSSHPVRPGAPPPGFQDQWRPRQRDFLADHSQPSEAYELEQPSHFDAAGPYTDRAPRHEPTMHYGNERYRYV